MLRIALCGMLLMLTSCTPLKVFSDEHDYDPPATPPQAPLVSQTDLAPPPLTPPPALTPVALVQPPPTVVETLTVDVAYAPAKLDTPPSSRRSSFAPPPMSPLQLVQEGQQGARIGPGSHGYRQQGAMHFYTYELGGVYDLHVSPTLATGILFPPGDAIKVGLFLPKDDFDVETKSTGQAAASYDALTIHPKIEKGEYDAFVLMTNGKAYLFHLIVGKKGGMLTVSFDVPNS